MKFGSGGRVNAVAPGFPIVEPELVVAVQQGLHTDTVRLIGTGENTFQTLRRGAGFAQHSLFLLSDSLSFVMEIVVVMNGGLGLPGLFRT